MRHPLEPRGTILRIKSMVEKDADGTTQSRSDCIDLPPQGVTVLISEETIMLPKHICAYASVKTSLCREGVLAINSGVVDRAGTGLSLLSCSISEGIGTPFGKEMYFFDSRSTGWLIRPKPNLSLRYPAKEPIQATLPSDYEVGTVRKFQKHLASSFMDLHIASREAMLQFKSELKTSLFKYVPLAVGVLAIITF